MLLYAEEILGYEVDKPLKNFIKILSATEYFESDMAREIQMALDNLIEY